VYFQKGGGEGRVRGKGGRKREVPYMNNIYTHISKEIMYRQEGLPVGGWQTRGHRRRSIHIYTCM
jgi:hypothetical protein